MSGDGGESRTRQRDGAIRGRGVSEITGLILLFGIVMAGVALILITSTAVQDDLQQQNRLDAAEAFRGVAGPALARGVDADHLLAEDDLEPAEGAGSA